MSKYKLPAPRLQLRWAESTDQRWMWMCHYELVVPLGEYDIRAEQEGPRGGKRPSLTEIVVALKEPSCRLCGVDAVPCTAPNGDRYCDTPYRDGAHALWDAAHLGNPPIYVIAPDGTAFLHEAKP